MTQGIAARKLTALGVRPDFWLAGLLLWLLLSAGRSLETPWATAALTEALRWGGGIGLALALGWSLRHTAVAGQFLVTLTGAMALFGILGSAGSVGGLSGPYHDHQLYGSILLLLLPFSAALAFTAPQAAWRWGALAVLAAGTLCLFLSQTRSAWAGLAAAGLVFGWLWLKRTPFHPHKWRAALVPALLLLIGLIAVWVVAGPADQRIALSHRASTFTALSQDESWQSRLGLWRGTMGLIGRHPAFGIGLGHYPGEMPTGSGGHPSPQARPSLSSEAHSFYLQTAAEIGLTGLGLYLAALAAFARLGLHRLGRHRRPLREQDGLLIASLSALAGQGIDAVASPSWQFPEVSFFFWAVLGLGLAALQREQAQTASPRLPLPIRRLGQFALSGSLAVVLAAQILPIGLLTPVEAYTHPAAYAYQSVAVSPMTPCVSGAATCSFLLTANYTNGSQDVTFDSGSGTGIPATFTCKVSPNNNTCVSRFGTSGSSTRNQLTVSASEKGKTLLITGSFEDASVSSSGTTTYTGHTSPAITIMP